MVNSPIEPLPKGTKLKDLVPQYLDKWENLQDYPQQEAVLQEVFTKFPKNIIFSEVMQKIGILNSFYSTRLNTFTKVANRILSIPDFDKKLNDGEIELVDEICKIQGYTPFSFATKYCSHHNPSKYPIFDSFVSEILCYYQNNDSFFKNNKTLSHNFLSKSYKTFYDVIKEFQNFYDLNSFTFKELDRFLWLLGKEFFVEYKLGELNPYVIVSKSSKYYLYELCQHLKKGALPTKVANEHNGIATDKDFEFVKLMLSERCNYVSRKDGIIGNFFIKMDKDESIYVYHNICSISNDSNVDKNLENNLKIIARKVGLDNIDRLNLYEICNEIIAQQSNKKDVKVDKESPQDEEIKTKPMNNDKNVEEHEQDIPPKIRTSIKIGDYTIEIAKTNAVSIKGGKESKPVKPILKDISKLLEGFKWEEKWNTHDAGRHIVKYAREHPERIKSKIE